MREKTYIVILLSVLYLGLGCVSQEIKEAKVELVGQGHTYRDLRQHTSSTSKSISYSNPDISPDGKTIALAVRQGGDSDIYIKNVDGRAMTQKTFQKTDDIFPSFLLTVQSWLLHQSEMVIGIFLS